MSTMSHHPDVAPEGWASLLRVRELWSSLAITTMWVAVAVTSVWGPSFVSTSSPTNNTTIPSGIFVAIFAAIGTWAVAKYGFSQKEKEQK